MKYSECIQIVHIQIKINNVSCQQNSLFPNMAFFDKGYCACIYDTCVTVLSRLKIKLSVPTLMQAEYDESTWSSWLAFLGSLKTLTPKKQNKKKR